MIESMLWMLGGIASLRRFLRTPKTGVKIEIDGWDSFYSLPSWRVVFLFTKEKKMPWMLTGAVFLETVLLSIQDKCLNGLF